MEYLKNSIKYLSSFFHSRYQDFFEAMTEYRPQKGYGNFYNDSEIVQCMRDITHNVEETFADLRIPEGFSTPESLINTVCNFINVLKDYETVFNQAINKYNDSNLIPAPIYEINKRRLDTIEALEHFVTMAREEMKKNNTNIINNSSIDDLEKVSLRQLFNFIGKLSLKSIGFIIGVFVVIVSITVYITNLSDTLKSKSLREELLSKNQLIEKYIKSSDSLVRINHNKESLDSINRLMSVYSNRIIILERILNTKGNNSENYNKKSGRTYYVKRDLQFSETFIDSVTSASVSITEIKFDKVFAIIDYPGFSETTSFGNGVIWQNKERSLTNGSDWSFKLGDKEYKMIITNLDSIKKQYSVTLIEKK